MAVHVAVAPLPDRVHVLDENEPLVPGLAEKVTVPEGVMVVPGEVSVTLAVQVDDVVTGTLAGEQDTLIDVTLVVAVTAPAPVLDM